MIVDGHAHVFLPADASPRDVDELVPARRTAPVEQLRRTMTQHAVDTAVLVALDAHDDYLARCLAEAPTVFAGVAVADAAVHGRSDEDPVAALRRRHQGCGFHALRTAWLGDPGAPIEGSPFWPVLRELEVTGTPLWSYLPPDQLPLLGQLGRLLPDLVVVLNHLGFGPHDMRVDRDGRPEFDNPFPGGRAPADLIALADRPSIVLMLSGLYAMTREGPPYDNLRGVVSELVVAFGAERTMWASDSPWIDAVPGYAETLALPAVLLPGASRHELDAVLGGTARCLFPHLRPTHPTTQE